MIVRYENACGNRRTVLPTAGSDERKFTQRDRRDSAQGYSLSEAGYRRGIAAVVAVGGRWSMVDGGGGGNASIRDGEAR